jgi:hypothetical protein
MPKGHRKMQDAAMTITKQTVADKIGAYLHYEITLAQLVDWAEQAMMDGELAEGDATTRSTVIARLGVADIRAFGLAWEDAKNFSTNLALLPA